MDFESDNFGVFASSRRSTRDFLPTPIPDEIIEEIIADGLTSPSWSNTRPIRWRLPRTMCVNGFRRSSSFGGRR